MDRTNKNIFAALSPLMILGVLTIITYTAPTRLQSSSKVIENDTIIKMAVPEHLLDDINVEYLYEYLKFKGISHPDIVLAQALLETGYFKSKIFKERNNLFGLYNSRIGEYYRFEHWTESVDGYINYIEYKYDPSRDSSYYDFLDRIGYAEDPRYIVKIKSIVNRLRKEGKCED